MTAGRGERFAQLTYTSSDRGDRPGGWGVQDVAGTLAAPERAELTRRVVPRFVPVTGLPAYPDPEQLAGRPARVVHAPAPGGGSAYWHTVACGTDAHGRPGNVFVHVLLDRGEPDGTPDATRPSDLAASACWLRPFGPAEVAATAVRDLAPPPWPAAPGRAAVLEFLFGEGGGAPGIATLCLLLDALDAAPRGGGPVVLAVGDTARAACWVAVADHLSSLGAARARGWSTYERVPYAREWPAELALVVVPAADVEHGGADGLVATVLGEDEEVPRAELGDAPRTTRRGVPVAVTPWSVMAFVVLADRAGARAVLERMDAVGAAVPEARHPAWAMAMAVAQAPDLARDAVPAAREILETATPPRLAGAHPELYDAVLALVAETVAAGAAGALAALNAATGGRRAILRDLCLLRLLDEGLEGPEAPVAALGAPDRPVAARVGERAAQRLASLLALLDGAGRLDALARGNAVLDLVDGAGADLRTEATVTAWWDRVLALLVDPVGGPAVAGRLSGAPVRVVRDGLDDALRRWLRRVPGAPGTRVPAAVLRLVGVRVPTAAELVARGGPDELQRELAALVVLADPAATGAAWVARLWDLLDEPGAARGDELAALVRDGADPAGTRDLAVLLAHREHPALHRPALRGLLAAPDDEHLDGLVDVVLAPRPAGVERPRRLVDAAWLRRLVADPVPDRRDELLALAASLLPAVPPQAVARAVWRALLVALVADAVVRAWHAPDPPGWSGADRVPATVRRGAAGCADAAVVAALADGPELEGAALVHAALVLRAGEAGPGTEALHALDGPAAALLVAVARRRRRDGTLGEADREAALRRLRRDRRGPGPLRRRGHAPDDPETLARQWWDEVTSEPVGTGG